MSLELADNGIVFTDEHFNKFKRLLDVEERSHKGLGRLVYLCFFDRVKVESVFEANNLRKFKFSDEFDGQYEVVKTQQRETGSKLVFRGFNGEHPIVVNICLSVGGITITETINGDSIPEFQVRELTDRIELFDSITLYYYIHELDNPAVMFARKVGG